jgi:inositol-hexakisphosphate kinase
MSSSLPEPENAAPTGPVRAEQGYKNSQNGDQQKSRPWTQPPRSKSTSLLTQSLATNYEADESPSAETSTFPHSQESLGTQSDIPSGQEHRNNGMSTADNIQCPASEMATIASMSAGDLRRADTMGLPSTSNSTQFNLQGVNTVNGLLTSHRKFLNKAGGRGTSLERTDKEKRVQDHPKSLYSTNAGDTGMTQPVSPLHPTSSASISASISNNHPTEGVRAEYRSWRDARPSIIAEKAWSIGAQGGDGSHGGQVEKSITDALAGIEPSNRSRKSSHSLRFFKEGLPEDRFRKRDSINRGRSKDSSSFGSLGKQETDKTWTGGEQNLREPAETHALGSHSLESGTPFHSPVERERHSTRHDLDPSINPTEGLAPVEGYFDPSHHIETVSNEQLKSMPPQLLAEIRKHHNLTPGAPKHSSFSGSIPVTESEKPKTGGPKSEEDKSDSKELERIRKDAGDGDGDGADLSRVKTLDEGDDSGEEQVSSAVFLPHQTPHESPEEGRDGTKGTSGVIWSDQQQIENSQWLEEHVVLSRDVDEKYLAPEVKPRPLLSPALKKRPSTFSEDEKRSVGAQILPDIDRDSHDEAAYSTPGEEDVGLTDGSDTTPTGSLKTRRRLSKDYKQHIHDHQQKPKEPLDAIELIPYRHQVGGHTTMWRFSKRAVCKQLNNRENQFYETVERYHRQLLRFLPRYGCFHFPSRLTGPEAESLQRPLKTLA